MKLRWPAILCQYHIFVAAFQTVPAQGLLEIQGQHDLLPCADTWSGSVVIASIVASLTTKIRVITRDSPLAPVNLLTFVRDIVPVTPQSG